MSWSVRRTSRLAWTDTLRVEGQTPTARASATANAPRHHDRSVDEPQPQFEKARALLEGPTV
jgi:urease accessory protein